MKNILESKEENVQLKIIMWLVVNTDFLIERMYRSVFTENNWEKLKRNFIKAYLYMMFLYWTF